MPRAGNRGRSASGAAIARGFIGGFAFKRRAWTVTPKAPEASQSRVPYPGARAAFGIPRARDRCAAGGLPKGKFRQRSWAFWRIAAQLLTDLP